MKKVSWKEAKLAHLRFFYGRLAVAWEGESDDRGLFSNTYKMIVNAVSSLPENPGNYVRCAMNHAISADLEMMDRIAVRFSCR